MKIRIETFLPANSDGDIDTANAEPESMKRIDWDSSADRKWFMNHFTWAINNSRVVLVTPPIKPVESN